MLFDARNVVSFFFFRADEQVPVVDRSGESLNVILPLGTSSQILTNRKN